MHGASTGYVAQPQDNTAVLALLAPAGLLPPIAREDPKPAACDYPLVAD